MLLVMRTAADAVGKYGNSGRGGSMVSWHIVSRIYVGSGQTKTPIKMLIICYDYKCLFYAMTFHYKYVNAIRVHCRRLQN